MLQKIVVKHLPVWCHPTWFAPGVRWHHAKSSAHSPDPMGHHDRAKLENDIDRYDVRLCSSTRREIRAMCNRWSNSPTGMSLWHGPTPWSVPDLASILRIFVCPVRALWLSLQWRVYSLAKSCSRSRQSYLADSLALQCRFWTFLSHLFWRI